MFQSLPNDACHARPNQASSLRLCASLATWREIHSPPDWPVNLFIYWPIEALFCLRLERLTSAWRVGESLDRAPPCSDPWEMNALFERHGDVSAPAQRCVSPTPQPSLIFAPLRFLSDMARNPSAARLASKPFTKKPRYISPPLNHLPNAPPVSPIPWRRLVAAVQSAACLE